MFGFSEKNHGTWTGWLCDQESMKTISKQRDPLGYLEQYPRSKASNLNTLFKGLALYHHGQWFILDKHGSELAKRVIARSDSNSGFFVTVQGVRKGDKIKVTGIFDKTQIAVPVIGKLQQNQSIRNDFKLMGI